MADHGVGEAVAPVGSEGAMDALAAWRALGAHGSDPVRFHFIEALARRATAQQGKARHVLDARVATLLQAYRAALTVESPTAGHDTHPADPDDANDNPAAAAAVRGPLAALLDHIARHATLPDQGSETDDRRPGTAPPELKALGYFRGIWSKLSADQRLKQSLAQVPDNAGPLHSHHLVHRSLTLMRDLSPDYLNRFMAYVDTLLWLDQADSAGKPPVKAAPRAEGLRRPRRGKPDPSAPT